MHITLDPVKFDDPVHLRWWYEIRNAETTRKGCRSVKKITVDEHYIWWHESKLSKTRKLFFVRRHHGIFQPQVVGIARLDHRKAWTEISIAIGPEWRGQGFGTVVVQQLVKRIELNKWPVAGAVVNGKNAPSLLVFLKAGFLVKKKGFVQLTRTVARYR